MARRKKTESTEPFDALPQMSGDTTAADQDRDRIATRAYELYLARGGEHGRADEDWYTAEREITNGGHRENE